MNTEIREYLLAHRASDEVEDFSDDESLLETGVLDSVAMIDLIAHLEGTYTIQISEDDMTPENFETVEAIVAYVRAQQAAKAASDTTSITGD